MPGGSPGGSPSNSDGSVPEAPYVHGRWAVLVATTTIAAGLLVPSASAFQNGIAGYSGRQNQTCAACHFGGTLPEEVRFEGPTQVAVGATATFRFVLVSEAPSQDEAGFNVAASAGQLRVIAGQGARLLSNELTHSGPKDVDNDEAAWQFDWIAPATEGEQTLYGAGNAVNGNRNTTGDRALATTFTIQVVGGEPTPTASATATTAIVPPTHTRTATRTPTHTAPPSATQAPTASATSTVPAEPSPSATASPTSSGTAALPTATPSPTGTRTSEPVCVGDCDTDQRVTVAELVTGVNIAFERSPVEACSALDRDTDQRVTVAELVEAVRSLLEGC